MLRAGVLLAALLMAMPTVAQSNASAGLTANSLNIPSSQGIETKLQTNLDANTNKPGDAVQAETIRDLKHGHDMLLKKGSMLTGHIVKVQTFSGGTPSFIVILFDQVTPKGGQAEKLDALMTALAPAPTLQTDTLQDGRGMMQTNIDAAVAGDKDLGNGGELSANSVGVHGFSGVTLGTALQSGKQYSTIQSTSGDLKIKKGAQIVFKAAEH